MLLEKYIERESTDHADCTNRAKYQHSNLCDSHQSAGAGLISDEMAIVYIERIVLRR